MPVLVSECTDRRLSLVCVAALHDSACSLAAGGQENVGRDPIVGSFHGTSRIRYGIQVSGNTAVSRVGPHLPAHCD